MRAIRRNILEKIDCKSKALIEKHYGLVNSVANFMMIKFNGLINRDDLVEFGIMGLIDAAIKFDPQKNDNFKIYAITRIKGSILDGIRKLDYMPRNIRELSGRIEKTYFKLEQRFGRMPSDEEVANELGTSIEDFNDMLFKIRGASFLMDKDFMGIEKAYVESLETLEAKGPSAVESLLIDERKSMLMEHIETLEETEKNVLMLYYYEELTLKEIGVIMKLTESRICQIHSKAILKLRSKIKFYENIA